MNIYVSHERIYNDGDVKRSVSNAEENERRRTSTKIKMEGKLHTADSGGSNLRKENNKYTTNKMQVGVTG
jgi:hypothetical protein